jgi:phosphatidylglycerophosphatase A
MPGTIGSFIAIAFGYTVSTLGFWFYMAILALLIIAAYHAISAYEKASEDHDDQSIVVDEVIGMMIAGIPAIFEPGLWLWAFLLFRFFDVVKPFPISWADQKVKGALGVLLDDILAGIIALMGTATLGYYVLISL